MMKRLDQDMRPITIGGFELSETGVKVKGRPTFDQYQAAMAFAQRAQKASEWWLADLLRYGDEREDWAERLSQVQEATGLSEKRLKNIRAVGRIEPSRRRDDVEFALHEPVAGMSPDDQTRWLDKAASHGWTRSELRQNIRAARRREVIEAEPVMRGLHRVVYGAFGWQDVSLDTLTRSDMATALAAQLHDEAVLFLWVPPSLILAKPGVRDVLEAWGFEARTNMTWDKVIPAVGAYGTYVRHEHLVIATRGGACLPDHPTPAFDSVLVERQDSESWEKPASVRAMIERLYDGPYLEVLPRGPVPDGWTALRG